MDVDKILIILEQIEVLGVAGKKVMADGKVDLTDLPVLVGSLANVGGMIEAFKGASEALGEAKDLDSVEGLAIVQKLYEIGLAIEKA